MENQSPPQIQTTQPASPTDPQYPPTTSMPTPAHPHGRFLPKWIAIFLLLLILSLFGLLFIKDFMWQQPIQQPEKIVISPTRIPTPTVTPAPAWRTYTGNGMSFEYPGNGVVENGGSAVYIAANTKPYFIFSVEIVDNPKHLTAQQVALEHIDAIRTNPNAPWLAAQAEQMSKTMKPYENGIIKGIALPSFFEGDPSGFGDIIYTTNDKIYTFSIHNGDGYVNDIQEKMLDHILSTLKFTDTTTSTAQTNACDQIKNARFASVDQQTGGMTPQGAGKSNWSIRFAETTFNWMYTDVVLSSFFTCVGNKITVKDSTITGIYDPQTQTLLWNNIEYKKVNSED